MATYFILLARISSRDSKQVLNVSYLFVDEGEITPYVHHYWGWSGWVFIGAAAWSLLMLPFLCGTIAAHGAAKAQDMEYVALSLPLSPSLSLSLSLPLSLSLSISLSLSLSHSLSLSFDE